MRLLRGGLGILAIVSTSQTMAAPPAETAPLQLAADCVGVKLSRDSEAAIERLMKEGIESGKIIGATVGVAKNGCPVFIRGYGLADAENAAFAMSDTSYMTASTGKQFTAAAVLVLVDRGLLGLDDPLSKYLPDFPGARDVKIRHLLNHTSGIHNYVANPDWRPVQERLDQDVNTMVAYIAKQPKLYDFAPGTAWNYSNSGYYLLGAVIEKVTGGPWDVFVRDNVFLPLGMRDTAYDNGYDVVKNRARDYVYLSWDNPDRPQTLLRAPSINGSVSGPAGGYRTTARDYLLFHSGLLGGRLLKPATLSAMLTPGRLNDGRRSSENRLNPRVHVGRDYGFGIFIDRDVDGFGKKAPVGRALAHAGGIGGFNTNLATYLDHAITIAFLANSPRTAENYVGPLALAVIAGEAAGKSR
jgi:CubicO group peptidase (beta-lactamase class C family)